MLTRNLSLTWHPTFLFAEYVNPIFSHIPTQLNLYLLIKNLPQLSSEFRTKFKFFTKAFRALGGRRLERLETALCFPLQTLSPSGCSHSNLLSLQTPTLSPTSGPWYLLFPLPRLLSRSLSSTAFQSQLKETHLANLAEVGSPNTHTLSVSLLSLIFHRVLHPTWRYLLLYCLFVPMGNVWTF